MDDSVIAVELIRKIQYLSGRVKQNAKRWRRLGERVKAIGDEIELQRQQRAKMEFLPSLINMLEDVLRAVDPYVRDDAHHVEIWVQQILGQGDQLADLMSKVTQYVSQLQLEQRLKSAEEESADKNDDAERLKSFFEKAVSDSRYAQIPRIDQALEQLQLRSHGSAVKTTSAKCHLKYGSWRDVDPDLPDVTADDFGILRRGILIRGDAEAEIATHSGMETRPGMAHLYPEARDRVLLRIVDENEWTSESKKILELFVNKADSICEIRHDNILRLKGFSLDSSLTLMYEDVDGGTLYERIRLLDRLRDNGRHLGLPIPELLEYGSHVAAALTFIYSQRPTEYFAPVTSRSILLVGNTCKLLDVGIAQFTTRLVHPTNPLAPLQRAYLPPEAQDALNAPLLEPAAVYALGTLLWEMLAGEDPDVVKRDVPGRSPVAVARRITAAWDRDPKARPPLAEIANLLSAEKSVFASITHFFKIESLLDESSKARMAKPSTEDILSMTYVEIADYLEKAHQVSKAQTDVMVKEKLAGYDFVHMLQDEWAQEPFKFDYETASRLASIAKAFQ
eukprot:TRINITY_DN1152_c0_g1_i1.p1 TRINITY_DN1152_c0_g1~~TRINITY_DN1152_c0_g1_i1.p1  ORF type:complete len:564 (-),score=147.32 TRINITY_DN1152_c0_g1_i1:470-2161(-)